MTNDEYLKSMQKYSEELRKDPVRLKAFMRKVMGPPKRRLEGKERENIWVLILMSEPVSESNNQRFWYEEYSIGGKRYDVTYGLEDDPIVEVYEEDE